MFFSFKYIYVKYELEYRIIAIIEVYLSLVQTKTIHDVADLTFSV